MKTIREVLQEAYPEHMDRIEELTREKELFNDEAKDVAGYYLAGMFCFAQTDEGHKFWVDLANQHGWEA